MLEVAQIGITVFGVAAFLLVTQDSRRVQIIGAACGFSANPFWWLLVITTQPWLKIPVHAVYTFGWIWKAWRLWPQST